MFTIFCVPDSVKCSSVAVPNDPLLSTIKAYVRFFVVYNTFLIK